MSGQLFRRILGGVAVSALLVGVGLIGTLRVSRSVIQDAVLANLVGKLDMQACDENPASWGWRSGKIAFFSYDQNGHSQNPEAPPIEGDLLREVLASRTAVISPIETHNVSLIPRSSGGPCAIVRVVFGNAGEVFTSRLLTAVVGVVTASMLIGMFGMLWFVIRPLQRRIDELAVAASNVGSKTFATEGPASDALGQIAAVLSTSHERIEEQQTALKERNRALEDHLASIAHDLRTPLASMHLALEAVAAESQGDLHTEARRALADTVYLSSMVENLHQATRLRHEVEVTSGEVDLADLVHRLEQRFAIVGRHAGIEVAANAPEDPVVASCTPALAERAVANLIQNAIEHNTSGGHVAVTLTVTDDRFAITVADDGPGLPPEQLASLEHESFVLGDARPRGPGLGMMITAEVTRRAQWKLTYKPKEPRGLTVVIAGSLAKTKDKMPTDPSEE